MRRLMLLRHAKTETDAPSGKDFDRRLDDRGRSDAAEIGAWLASYRHLPDLALVSTAVRARQTWDIVHGALKATPQPLVADVPEIYGAGPSQLLHIIHAAEAEDPKGLLLVGHNPGLGDLASVLIAAGDVETRQRLIEKFPTAGLAVIDFAVVDWTKIHRRGGRLDRFVVPRALETATD